MDTLIGGAVFIAVLFIYNALRTMIAHLEKIEQSIGILGGRPAFRQTDATVPPGPDLGAFAAPLGPVVTAQTASDARFRQAELDRQSASAQEAAEETVPAGWYDPAVAAREDATHARRLADEQAEYARKLAEYEVLRAEYDTAQEAARAAAASRAELERRATADRQAEADRRRASREAELRRQVGQMGGTFAASPEPVAGVDSGTTMGADRETADVFASASQSGSSARPDAQASPTPDAPVPKKPGIDWELLSGGRIYSIIGALVLIIGTGLLLKYAFDQNWINAITRVIAGVVVGGAVVATGHVIRGRSKETWYGDGIVGMGLGTLYLSGYASFQSYHLVPFQVAYAYMSVVTLVAFGLALRYDSIWISLIGWAGGFLTPFIVSDGAENELGLASYIVVLDLSMAAIGIVKSRWFAMQPLAMAATYVGAFAWYVQNAGNHDWFVSVIALLSLWFVFFASGVANTIRRGTFSAVDAILMVVNGLVFMSYLEGVVDSHQDAFTVAVAAVALAYAAAYAMIALRLPAAAGLRAQYATATAVAMLAATVSHDRSFAADFGLEGLAILAIARTIRTRLGLGDARELLAVGFGLFGLGWVLGAFELIASATPHPWDLAWGRGDATALVLAGAALAIERLFATDRLLGGNASGLLRALALGGACSLVLAHAEGLYGQAATFAVFALALGWIGTRAKLVDLEIEALFLLVIAEGQFWMDPETYGFSRIFGYVPIANERFLTLGAIGAVTIVLGELARRRGIYDPAIGRALRLIGALTLTVGGTFEVHDGFRIAVARLQNGQQTASVLATVERLVNSEPLAIMGLWIAISAIMLGLGVTLRVREFRIYAIAVLDIAIFYAFYDLQSLPNPYKIFAFMGLGLTLLCVSALYSRLETGFFGKHVGGGASPGSG